MLLEELLQLQKETQMPLISDHEVRLVREQWKRDEIEDLLRRVPCLNLAVA
jgi:hypothetical protein